MPTLVPIFLLLFAAEPAPPTVSFDAPKYGLKVAIPKDWPVAARERDDLIFVAKIDQADPERPGVAACELGLAPENLDEYRTRIDGNAKRGGGGKLARNEIVKGPKGERLESLKEFRPPFGGVWRELSVRVIQNRQMYTFLLNADEATYPAAKVAFDALIDSAVFTPPNTGADRVGDSKTPVGAARIQVRD